jgi:hypothetical protein
MASWVILSSLLWYISPNNYIRVIVKLWYHNKVPDVVLCTVIYVIYLAYYDTVIYIPDMWLSLWYTWSIISKCQVYIPLAWTRISEFRGFQMTQGVIIDSKTMRSCWLKVCRATRTAAAASLPPCAATSESGWNKNVIRSLQWLYMIMMLKSQWRH